MKTEEKKKGTARKILAVAGVVVCALLLPILTLNIIFLVLSFTDPENVPSFFGVTPMVVVTDSMDPVIRGGDMIVDLKCDPEEVRVGDVISFFDPARAKKDVVITHRVVGISEENGTYYFETKGDANNAADEIPVPARLLVGVYKTTIPVIGGVVLFMRTPLGVLLTVIVPILAVIAYDLIRRRKYEKEKKAALESAEHAPVTNAAANG